MMARGYEGAFGRAVNRWRIWIPLSLVFLLVLLPITRPRHLLSWRTLDLLALLSFTVSWAWFNEGDIFTSVPLQYPPLLYLLARMAWITVRRARVRRAAADANPGDSPSPGGPGRAPGLPGWMPAWLLVTVLIVLTVLTALATLTAVAVARTPTSIAVLAVLVILCPQLLLLPMCVRHRRCCTRGCCCAR